MTKTLINGLLVAERFRIVRFIAEGGMGEVYEAKDEILGERVALKFLRRQALHDEQALRRFRREIQLARKVTHKNVCRIHDVFQFTPPDNSYRGRESTFVTMELLLGETLSEFLEREGRLSEAEALPIALQMAEALEAAHAAGIIHRDFKSSNVILVPEEDGARAVVTDFGLARSAETGEAGRTPITGETRIVGTVDHMAPEQLHGQEVTPASDVYSLGVVLYQMVTGTKPYTGPNPMAILARRLSDPPVPPRDLVPELGERWHRTILGCLEAVPEDRFQLPREVASALLGEEVAFGGPQSSGTIAQPAKLLASRPAGRKPRRLAAVLAVAGLAIVTTAALLTRTGGPEPFTSFDPVQLTTARGLELDPVFSPDGTALAYSSEKSGSFEIYRQRLEPGAPEVQLTSGGTQAFEPAFSPEGTSLVYHSKAQGGLWRMPAEGGRGSRLTAFGSRPTFSPDGRLIVFQSESSPQLSDTTAPVVALSTLWLVAADGSSLRQLTRAGEPPGGHGAPAFSPDGRYIAFSTSSPRGASEIWSIGVDGEERFLLIRDPATAYGPIYSHDGRGLYFSARSREVNSLWQLPISPSTGRPAGKPLQLVNLGLASIRQVAVAADGRLAYTAMQTVSNLWTLPLDPVTSMPAGEATALTHGNGRNNRPVFSPAGDQVAFDSWRQGVHIGVWLMDADRGAPRRVTLDPWTSSHASWLPSDGSLAFVSARDGQRSYWAVRPDSTGKRLLTELPSDVDWAKLSPDGGRLAYHSRTGGLGLNVWVLDLAAGEHRQLTFDDNLMAFPSWSPDGEWIAFDRQDGEDTHVMLISALGGEARQLTHQAGQHWPFSFSPDGDKIAFAAERSDFWSLRWVSRTSGKEQLLVASPRLNIYLRYPAWSPRNDRVVYELAETTGNIWLVDGRR